MVVHTVNWVEFVAEDKIYQGGLVDLSGSKPLSGYTLSLDCRLLDSGGNHVPVAEVSAGIAMNTANTGDTVFITRCWTHAQPVFEVQ